MKKGSKSSKKVTRQPFAKRESSGAMGLIVALTVFNLVYSYAVGLPLPRAVVSSYVESVYELGDAQVASYEMMGAAVVGTIGAAKDVVTSEAVYEDSFNEFDSRPSKAFDEGFSPEPLLLVEPNQLSLI